MRPPACSCRTELRACLVEEGVRWTCQPLKVSITDFSNSVRYPACSTSSLARGIDFWPDGHEFVSTTTRCFYPRSVVVENRSAPPHWKYLHKGNRQKTSSDSIKAALKNFSQTGITPFGEVSKYITGALALSFEVSYQDLHDLTLFLNLESIWTCMWRKGRQQCVFENHFWWIGIPLIYKENSRLLRGDFFPDQQSNFLSFSSLKFWQELQNTQFLLLRTDR
jgi:hypothetical protein